MESTNFFQEMAITEYEFDDDKKYIWFKLDDVFRLTGLTERNLQDIPEEERNIRELIDGTKVIQEPGAYFLMFFVSEAPAVKNAQNWLFHKVLPDIETKGYYMKGEKS